MKIPVAQTVVIMFSALTCLLAGEGMLPDLTFLTGSGAQQLKVVTITDLTKLALPDADIVLWNGEIARISMYDKIGAPDGKIFPENAAMLSGLRILICVNCGFAQALPRYYDGLPQLRHFEITGNAIAANMESHKPPPALRVFRVSNTEFIGAADAFFLEAKELEYFDISNTRISISPSQIFLRLPKLGRGVFSSSSVSLGDGNWERELGPGFDIIKSRAPGQFGDIVIVTSKIRDQDIDGKPKAEVLDDLKKLMDGRPP